MDDPRDVGMQGRDLLHRGAVGNVGTMKRKTGKLLKYLEPGFFQRRIVVVVDDVDADDGFSAIEQFTAGVEADKSGCAGYKICHSSSVKVLAVKAGVHVRRHSMPNLDER